MTDLIDETDDDLSDPAEPSPKSWLYPFLAELGITRIEASMSGGGDSGQIDDVTYYRGDETVPNEEVEGFLASLTLDDGSSSGVTFKDVLETMFENDGSSAGDWINNEGGSAFCSYDLSPELGRIRLVDVEYTPGEEYEDENDDWDPDGPDEQDDDVEP